MNQSTRNVIIFLAVCIVFVSTAHCEICYYTGQCLGQEAIQESCGWWSTCVTYRTIYTTCTQTSSCYSIAGDASQGARETAYSLSSCGSCSVTCGGGVQYCTYQCRAAYCSLPDTVRIQNCTAQTCPPVNGGWGLWASWTSACACSVTCGGGTYMQTRTRSCNSPVPQYGGAQCIGNSTEYQTLSCSPSACPADVNGSWSAWNGWTTYGTCTVTCDKGIQVQTRNRTCTNPIPQNGGRQCNGTSTESQTTECNTQTCPIEPSIVTMVDIQSDGNWGAWNGWTSNAPCSVTCGGGTQTQTRNRTCTNPIPQNGGRQCNGTSTESQTIQCCSQTCPLDGSWSAWNNWSLQGACSVTCDRGVQVKTRNRVCTNPVPLYGGRPCNGTSVESQTIECTTQPCSVDGNWGAWNSWTSNATCSVTCGTGIKTETRTRTCSNPIPQNGGRQCNGTSVECQTILCNTAPCVINGGWSAWNSWISNGLCSVNCSGCNEVQTRNRTCTNPIPQNGGRQCNGTSVESQTIQCGSQTCPVVDGGWGPWCGWITDSECSVTCGGGTKTQRRTRTCSNPWPLNGGRECIGNLAETRIVQCNPLSCPPVDGSWSAWTAWTANTAWNATCVKGTQTRTRTRFCTNPSQQNCGRPCNGSSVESVVIQCNKQTCPPECTSSGNIFSCSMPLSAMTRTLKTPDDGGSGCNSLNCTCAEISHGYIRHPTDCTKFIQCAWNTPFVDSCKNGTYWDQSQLKCRRGTC